MGFAQNRFSSSWRQKGILLQICDYILFIVNTAQLFVAA